ncbi:MAG TPA: cell division FtsA domain-containing protein, partial [Clostridia bacterium]|nr:cell division FtsA domain-containing protein [Clostridia bacterium]
KEMGVLMIDVGAGVTDVSVFRKNNLVFYDSIPVGGDHITNDISIGLKVSFGEAEKIKKQYNLALTSLIKNDQDISINDTNRVNKKSIKVSEAVEIIEARVYEMFSLCKEMLQNAEIDMNLSAGTVLTGGGISRLDGCIQLAGEIFELPVRIAENRVAGISKDEFVTSAGMIKYIFSNKKGLGAEAEVVAAMNRTPQKKKKNKLLEKLSRFFSDFF